MSKILIFRYETTNGPGYLSHFLDRNDIAYQVLKVDQNEAIPSSIDGASALVFMGGGMSANDDLHWIPPTMGLIQEAQRNDIPMLGHCLGGQLLCKALGGIVTKNSTQEIGWLPVDVVKNSTTPKWCRELPSTLNVFHWHNETFSIPPEATHIFESVACPHQGFQIGNTIALQFHLEILPKMVADWASHFLDQSHTPGASIQSHRTMVENLTEKAEASKRVAEQIYSHWCGVIT